MSKMPPKIPTSRPSLSKGAKSLRAYRRTADYAIECVLAGIMAAREGMALVNMADKAANMYMAEKQLAVHLVDKEDDHPLGEHGGVDMVALEGTVEGLEIGYDTITPEPEAEALRDAVAQDMAAGLTGSVAGRHTNPYPTHKREKFPVPQNRVDVNKSVDG